MELCFRRDESRDLERFVEMGQSQDPDTRIGTSACLASEDYFWSVSEKCKSDVGGTPVWRLLSVCRRPTRSHTLIAVDAFQMSETEAPQNDWLPKRCRSCRFSKSRRELRRFLPQCADTLSIFRCRVGAIDSQLRLPHLGLRVREMTYPVD